MAEKEIEVQKESEPDYGNIFFHWQFNEFQKHQRSKSWYVWLVIIFIGLMIYSLVSRNLLFALFIILATMVSLMMDRNNREIDFKIAEDGILVGGKFYPYSQFKDFYIIYQPPVKTIYFDFKNLLMPRIPVDLQDQDPVKIREVLSRYLDEDLTKENEPLSDQFGRFFKL
ncbi:MAG: hypothetical protein JW816_02900 [Candidatus Buchananbacteria bacterium]|nr:hypothetical protein [Candidatus Buchananbacteria bacterium]